jgi:hypothetical protein
MRTLLLPLRVNLLGGWSDHDLWDGPAAVVNAAVGWHRDSRDPAFRRSLGRNVSDALRGFEGDARECAMQALLGWERLEGQVPEMRSGLPEGLPDCWGAMYVGAGGGGFGLAFARKPERRIALMAALQDRGMRSWCPVLLDGARLVED